MDSMGCSLSAQIFPASSQHLLTISLWILFYLLFGPFPLYDIIAGRARGYIFFITLQNLFEAVFLPTYVNLQYSVSILPFVCLLAFLYSFANFWVSRISNTPIILIPPMAWAQNKQEILSAISRNFIYDLTSTLSRNFYMI